MRLKDKCFTTPFCIFEDDLPDKAHILLSFLFSRSTCGGVVEITYDELMAGAHIESRTTVAKHLTTLASHGWFESWKRRGNKPAKIILRVPEIHEQHIVRKNLKYSRWKANHEKLAAHMRGKAKAISCSPLGGTTNGLL